MEIVEIIGTVKAITDAAILVDDGDNDIWLPLSQIKIDKGEYMKGDDLVIEIPEWLAFEKGLT